MAKQKKKKKPRIELVSIYKKFVNKNGTLPESVKELAHFADMDYTKFRTHFKSLEELEIAIILWYFSCADTLLQADKESQNWEQKDRHAAFLYLLVEQATGDALFLSAFVDEKRKSPSFMSRFAMTLNAQKFSSLHHESKTFEMLGPLSINPKKAALTNHALSVLWFFAIDQSQEKQDTDAFIEKTTDLLFKLTDTSMLTSMFDLGKFMVTRKNNAFSWN